MKLNKFFVFTLLTVMIWSCNNDDDGPNNESVPPRSLSEVAAENDAEIQDFLRTHFYNYEEFETPPEDFDFKIRIDTIAGANSNKEALINQVEVKTIKVSAFEFLLEGEQDVEHKYYYLEARPGEGLKPTIADSTFVRYQGSLLNGDVFDDRNTGVWWDNPGFQFPGEGFNKDFRGVAEGVVNTAAGTNIIDNSDGTFQIDGYGVGMIIIPSGLSTFNGNRPPISAYSPLIFKFDVLTIVENTDHDNDGIPSILEDLDSDGFLPNDNSDGDTIANFQDADDDNDGTPTREEITINADGTITFPDTDGDGIEDYLDSDS
ncbi:FKBP-type peptidyl-prolyl cis-trans isomerase [Costertonia aggregata]|uniref:Uncharacterized protein n=1 Tax=Costertonia aggregata TaxID=343403 RepID=A0A7H9AL67_9FLAO|nr:hypothetical protein [Costertonia aggregata]QLG44157.1 hypothetical protein HYG79_01940 [Costertonia aggregata]